MKNHKCGSGGTDSYFLRTVGIDVFNFTPINNTQILLHDNNERIHENTLCQGVEIYTRLINNLSSLQ